MKKPEETLKTIADIYIKQNETEQCMNGFKSFLESYLYNLNKRNSIPSRSSTNWHSSVMKLENNPETWHDSQEIWSANWLLDEVRNILSSLDQINICLTEKQQLLSNGDKYKIT